MGCKLDYDPGAVPGIAHPIGVLASTRGVDSIPRPYLRILVTALRGGCGGISGTAPSAPRPLRVEFR
jgi:hypothetical protein